MIKSIKKKDIPGRPSNHRPKSDWRIKAEHDIQLLMDSDDEAIEFIDLMDPYEVKRRRATLIQVIHDLGINGVKVVKRGNRLFVVKEEGYE